MKENLLAVNTVMLDITFTHKYGDEIGTETQYLGTYD